MYWTLSCYIMLYQSIDLLSIYLYDVWCHDVTFPALGLNTIHFPVDVPPPFITSDPTKTWKFHHWSVHHFQSWNPPWICRISRFCVTDNRLNSYLFVPLGSAVPLISAYVYIYIFIYIYISHTYIYVYIICAHTYIYIIKLHIYPKLQGLSPNFWGSAE